MKLDGIHPNLMANHGCPSVPTPRTILKNGKVQEASAPPQPDVKPPEPKVKAKAKSKAKAHGKRKVKKMRSDM